FTCQSCARALYDRTQKKCGYCGAEIPEALRFSKQMVDDLKAGKFSEKDRMELRPDGGGDAF
ncbi:MAG: hypothetical protein NTV51_15850, partial [Verrucomicrobia bacterium]|nr:hypothetical protein [Verrucomicrobiota bacterium]